MKFDLAIAQLGIAPSGYIIHGTKNFSGIRAITGDAMLSLNRLYSVLEEQKTSVLPLKLIASENIR